MNETHKKILNTKKALLDALCIQIKTKNLREITVSELCREAGINRTTFYKYYAIPGDILTEYVEETFSKVLGQVGDPNAALTNGRLYEIMLRICQVYSKNMEIMKVYMAFSQDMLPIIQTHFGKNLNSILDEQQSLLTFISGGVAYIIMRWGMTDYKQTPEQIASLLTIYILKVSDSAPPTLKI